MHRARPAPRLGDITYISTWEGWAYLAMVIDLASRKVVGWTLADHMRTDLVTDALDAAFDTRQPLPGAIFHSDRGSQYTSIEEAKFARARGSCRRSAVPASAGITRWPSCSSRRFKRQLYIHTRAWLIRVGLPAATST